MNKIISVSQINANKCKCNDIFSAGVINNILSYRDNVSDIETGSIINIEKSILDKRGNSFTFPCGLIKYINDKVNKKGYSFEYQYVEPYKLSKNLKPSLPGITFENYQRNIISKVGFYKRGIIVGPTGAGKSIILGGIIAKFNIPPTLLIVPNRTIFKQMTNSFIKWFGTDKVGIVGNSIFNPKYITVALYQSLEKLKKWKERKLIKLLLIDEVMYINDSIIKFFKEIPNCYYRFGVTATPRNIKKEPQKAMEMMGYTGPIIAEATEKQVEARVTTCNVYLINYYCHIPKGTNYSEVLRQDILFSSLRNKKLLQAANKLALKQNKTVLFLLDEIKQGEIIEKIAIKMGLKPYLVHSKMKKLYIDSVKSKLNKRLINLCIATKVFGLGTDIPNVDCVVLASTRKSEIDTLQKIGRGRRRTLQKNELIVIDSVDKIRGDRFNKYFYDYSMQRLKIFKEKGWEINKIII